MENTHNTYSILVNTCDKFSDCWNPFFKLFSKYWSGYKGQIFLNTERKSYTYGGLNIQAVCGCVRNRFPESKRPTWSQCLIWALEQINTPFVLYLQEDYFFKGEVKHKYIDECIDILKNNNQIKCIYLSNPSVWYSSPSEFNNLYYVPAHFGRRVSCQAAIWRKDELLSLLRKREDAWTFEILASRRSAQMGNKYLGYPRNFLFDGKFEIIPYIYTGIIKGQWFPPVAELFAKHDIVIDFEKRGFLNPHPKDKPFKKQLKDITQFQLFKLLSDISMFKTIIKR